MAKSRRPSIRELVRNIVAGADTSSDNWWDAKVVRHKSGKAWVIWVVDPCGNPVEVLVPDDTSELAERLNTFHTLTHRQTYVLRKFIAAGMGR